MLSLSLDNQISLSLNNHDMTVTGQPCYDCHWTTMIWLSLDNDDMTVTGQRWYDCHWTTMVWLSLDNDGMTVTGQRWYDCHWTTMVWLSLDNHADCHWTTMLRVTWTWRQSHSNSCPYLFVVTFHHILYCNETGNIQWFLTFYYQALLARKLEQTNKQKSLSD